MSPRYSPGTSPGTSPPTTPETPAAAPAPTPMKPRKGRRSMKMLLWLIILALVAGGVYYWQNQKVSDLNKQLADAKAQIDRLNSQNYNYQQQLQAANQKSQAQQALTVKEWGVKVPLTSATSDMEYTMGGFNGKANSQASFRTKQLDTMFPNCTTDSVLIVRGQATDTFSGSGASTKTFKQQYDTLLADKNADWTKNVKPELIGSYHYIQVQSGAACATKAPDTTQESQIIQNIKDALNKLQATT